jgi:hypothetical protein
MICLAFQMHHSIVKRKDRQVDTIIFSDECINMSAAILVQVKFSLKLHQSILTHVERVQVE